GAGAKALAGDDRHRAAGAKSGKSLPASFAAQARHRRLLCRHNGAQGRSCPRERQVIHIRRATRADAAAIGRVHVETWQSTYAGLLPDKALAQMSDVRQSAWWSRVLSDPREARGVFVADDEEMGVVGFGSCGPVREPPDGLDGTETRVGEVYTLYVE